MLSLEMLKSRKMYVFAKTTEIVIGKWICKCANCLFTNSSCAKFSFVFVFSIVDNLFGFIFISQTFYPKSENVT